LSEELLKRAPLPGLAGGGAFFGGVPERAQFNGWKFRVQVDSARPIARSRGIHCEVESEGSWRQTSGLNNRNHIRNM